ncbi:MAG TPA: hypothetical protein VK357_03455 [Rubrobacteraceae bacterium]|jgi:predicted DNA-binding protein|nr:hypothetical protein [Rubrobacteraceae bacterium]
MPNLDYAEKQRIQRANQIFLRLRKELHDRDVQFAEKDVRGAAQSARWLREIIEQYAGDWEQTYEDALTESELTEEDEAYLKSGIDEAGGFLPFVQFNLRRLEEAAPDEVETGEPAAKIAHQDLMCGMVAGLVAGGVVMRNFFYFGFAVGMSRKAGCWQD